MRLVTMLLPVLASVAVTGAPARAVADPPPIQIFLPNVTVAAGSPGITTRVSLDPVVTPVDFRVTIDLSDVADLIRVDPLPLPDCTSTATLISCPVPGDHNALTLELVPVTGAQVGRSGKLTVSAAASNLSPGSHTATVTIAEGVDLAAGPPLSVVTPPGTRVSAPLTVRNVGSVPAHGVILALPAIRLADRYGNCDFSGASGVSAACMFDTVLTEGVSYAVSGLEILVPADASPLKGAGFNFSWLTPADYANRHLGPPLPPVPGTGPKLQLLPMAGVMEVPPQTDLQPDDNRSVFDIAVDGPNVADFEAIGATVSGAVGQILTLRIGVRNNGPVSVEVPFFIVGSIGFTMPAGVTVVTLPFFCSGHPGSDYGCPIPRRLSAGATMEVEVEVRADRPLNNAAGTVIASKPFGGAQDNNLANNTDTIVFNISGEGGLPITGASTASLATAGALLVALGAIVYRFGRRRRSSGMTS